jgi:hypothetical protein
MRQLGQHNHFKVITSRLYDRKVILPEEEEVEFRSLFRQYEKSGGERLALDRHFYYFGWTSRYFHTARQ